MNQTWRTSLKSNWECETVRPSQKDGPSIEINMHCKQGGLCNIVLSSLFQLFVVSIFRKLVLCARPGALHDQQPAV